MQNSSDDDDDDSKNNFILNKITENDDYDFSTNDDFINDFAAFLNFFTSENVTNSFADFLNISANVIKNSFADFFDFLTNEDARIFDSKIDETNERNKIWTMLKIHVQSVLLQKICRIDYLIITYLFIAAENTISQNSVFENINSEDDNEIKAQWSVSKNSDATQLIYYIEKKEDFNDVFSAQLTKHLK